MAAVALLLAGVCAVTTSAQAQNADAEQRTGLSMLAVCDWPRLSRDEQRMISELKLALDGYDIRVVDSGYAGFDGLGEDEQVALVQRMTRGAGDSSPVLWMKCDGGAGAVARLFMERETGPMVRSLQAETWEEMALVVREILIDDMVLPTGEDDSLPGGDPSADEPEGKPVEGEEPRALFGILTSLEIGGGLVGQVGASFLWGGGIAVDVRFPLGFFARVAVFGKVGPREEASEFLIVGHRIEPRLEVGYNWEQGRLGIGPLVGVSPMWSSIDFAMSEGNHQRESWWSARFACGVDGRWKLTERLSLVLDLTLGFMPSRRFYRRLSRATLLETPTMDMAATLGVVVGI